MNTSPTSNKDNATTPAKSPYYPTTSPYPTSPPTTTYQTPPTPQIGKDIYFLPATTYHPAPTPTAHTPEPIPLLDSTPVSNRSNTSRSPRFHEHISELEDTSSALPATTHQAGQSGSGNGSSPNPNAKAQKRWGSVLYADKDSPTLGLGDPNSSNLSGREAMMDEARRRQEVLREVAFGGGEGEGGKLRPGEAKAKVTREGKGEGEVSPDLSESPLERGFAVSPMGSLSR